MDNLNVDNITKVIDDSESQIKTVMRNPYVYGLLNIVLILYSCLIAPKLPKNVLQLLDNTFVKIGVVFLIAYMSNKNISVSLMIAIGFVVTIQLINKNKIFDISEIRNVLKVGGKGDKNKEDVDTDSINTNKPMVHSQTESELLLNQGNVQPMLSSAFIDDNGGLLNDIDALSPLDNTDNNVNTNASYGDLSMTQSPDMMMVEDNTDNAGNADNENYEEVMMGGADPQKTIAPTVDITVPMQQPSDIMVQSRVSADSIGCFPAIPDDGLEQSDLTMNAATF